MIYAFDASNGNEIWSFETFPDPWTSAPVYGSPAVSNGLVFIADEGGELYSLGRFTTTTKQVSGSITSFPIRLPESLWWDKFYANYSINKSYSSITFKLLDAGGTVLDDNLYNGQSLTEGGLVLNRSVRLQADFYSSNLSKNNPTLFVWNITLTTDKQPPFLSDGAAGQIGSIHPEILIG
jgi:hypothetical protein